jgi:hypothetical protein
MTVTVKGWVVQVVTEDAEWPVSAVAEALLTRVDGYAVFPTRTAARAYQRLMPAATTVRRATVTLAVEPPK